PDVAHLAGLARGCRLDDGPVAHHGLAARLPVDRPGRAVIVRLAFLGAVVDVGEYAEAELRVFVENLPLRHVVAEMPGHEAVALQQVLDERAHFLAPFATGILREDAVTPVGELLEAIAHGSNLLCSVWSVRSSYGSVPHLILFSGPARNGPGPPCVCPSST